MKLIFVFLFILNVLRCESLESEQGQVPSIIKLTLCQERSGCAAVGKYLVWTPMKDANGDPDVAKEPFEYKVVLVYKDYMTIYTDDQKEPLPQFANPQLFARTIYYSNLKLGCGGSGNRICTAKEFQEKNSDVKFTNLVVDTLQRRNIELNRQCILLPLTSGAQRDAGESLIYICEDKKNKLREFYQFRTKLGRLIDTYQLRQLLDYYNSANSVCQKESLVKTDDADGNMNTLMMRLYPDSLKAYEDPGSFHSQVMDLPLRDIDESILCTQVPDGILSGKVKENWNDNFDPKPIGTCCFMIPLVNGKEKFVCTHYDNPEDFDYQDCDRKIKNWIYAINVAVKRQATIRDFRQLNKKTKIFDCLGNKATDSFKNRLESSVASIDKMCNDLSTIAQGWSKQKCLLDKNDDIVGEIREISGDNQIIIQSLEKCIKDGIIKLGDTNYGLSFLDKYEVVDYRPKSFLEIKKDEEQNDQVDVSENSQENETIKRINEIMQTNDDSQELQHHKKIKNSDTLKLKMLQESSLNSLHDRYPETKLPLFVVKPDVDDKGEVEFGRLVGSIYEKSQELHQHEYQNQAQDFYQMNLNSVNEKLKQKLQAQKEEIMKKRVQDAVTLDMIKEHTKFDEKVFVKATQKKSHIKQLLKQKPSKKIIRKILRRRRFLRK